MTHLAHVNSNTQYSLPAIDPRNPSGQNHTGGPAIQGVAVLGHRRAYARTTGTSFAAPLVAARFTAEAHRLGTQRFTQSRQMLWTEALDLGAPGRDPVYGYGFLDAMPSATAEAR